MNFRWAFPLLALLVAPPASGAEIALNLVDPPGLGFFDTTQVEPVGGNGGTTLGAQRRIVFQRAAEIWQTALRLEVDVIVQSSFLPLACSPESGVLGAAGAIQIFADFEGEQWPQSWYASALANQLHGADLTPGPFDPGLLVPPYNDDIVVYLNSDLGTPGCLETLSWYYGLDNGSDPAGEIDLLNTALHEIAHGLGFANWVNDETGANAAGPVRSDVYSAFLFDRELSRHWNQMGIRERRASEINDPEVIWHGPQVTAHGSEFLTFRPLLRIVEPFLEEMGLQPASFGPDYLATQPLTAEVVEAFDGFDVASDACEPIVNVGEVSGKIALIDRGGCTFVSKVRHAQTAGAVAVLIANNLETGLPPMGDDGTGGDIEALSGGISLSDGLRIRSELPGVVASLTQSDHLLAGADDEGFLRVYAPDPVEPGSSISHFHEEALPNLLMEPYDDPDLQGATSLDLTPYLLQDLGWVLMADPDTEGPHCPVGSAPEGGRVTVGSCSTPIYNAFGPFAFTDSQRLSNAGCTLQDLVNACLSAATPDARLECLEATASYLVEQGTIQPGHARALTRCLEARGWTGLGAFTPSP